MRGRNLLRSPLVAMFAFVVLVGAGGLVYAHWFTNATLQGDVNTGGIGIGWWAGWTNDDGFDIGGDDDGGPYDGSFDRWGPESSADPSADGRYDKDVGGCWVDWWDGGYMHANVQNAYPSYHCTITGALEGHDDVPVKSTGLTVYASEFQRHVGYEPDWDGPVCWDPVTEQEFAVTDPPPDFDGDCEFWGIEFGPGDFYVFPVFEPYDVSQDGDVIVVGLEGETVLTLWSNSDNCGVQVDPGWWYDQEGLPRPNVSVTLHVEQGAQMHDNYSFTVHPRFVNWNEFDDVFCGLTLEDGFPPEG